MALLDIFNLADDKYKVYLFNKPGQSSWEKPRNCTMGYFFTVGSGGGGGGGRSSATTTRGAGGGGGSGSIHSAIVPLMFLPDNLYVYVGYGGSGATANNAGGSGELSYISTTTTDITTSTRNRLLISGNAASTGGALGPATNTRGTAGTASSLATQAAGGNYMNWGTRAAIIGQSGLNTTAAYGNTGLLLTGGGGGGISTANGIGVNGSGIIPSLSAGIAGSPGGNGSDGFVNFDPFFSYGGMGGGAGLLASDPGGNGGNGGNGSGGGGGGGGNPGGRGGRGGDGLIIIVCW